VVAIIGSLLVFLFAALGLLGVALQQTVPSSNVTSGQSRAAGYLGVLIIAACGSWGFASGIGLFRYRDWARISALVWSGITLVVGTLAFLVTLTIKVPVAPNAPPGTAALARLLIALFFGLPGVVAVWWLILFSRKSIRALFAASPKPPDGPLDESGFPARVPRSRVPLPVTVIAWILVGSSVSALLFLPTQPSRLLLMGRIFRGQTAAAGSLAFCAVGLACGIGLLRRKRWAFWLVVCYQLFALANGTFSLISPERLVLIKEITASHTTSTKQFVLPNQFFDAIAILTLLISAGAFVILLYYRPRLPADDASKSAGNIAGAS
jgi:hypothetical protein